MIELRMEAPGKNALGAGLMDHLLERLRAARGQPVLLTGAGDAFSAGLNLKEVAALDEAGMRAFLHRLEGLVSALYTYPGPTVALINGHAIAGGCVLALCCDHRVVKADPKLLMGLNEVALGLRFPPGVLRMVRDRIAPQHRSHVLLGAGLFGPDEALRLGLVDEVSPEPEAAARRRLDALAAHPAEAYAAAKETLRGMSLLDGEGYADTFNALLPAWVSEEVKQRIRGALEKKK